MPNIWTHSLFGLELIKQSGQIVLLQDDGRKNLFRLGCQGPDFLFYHHFLPWQKDKTMSALGSAMHTQACGPVLQEMVRGLAEGGMTLEAPEVQYVLGFLSHHVLDRNMHPYVFFKSGFKKWDHQRFEVILDTIMVKRHLGLETWKTPVWKTIDIGREFPAGIVSMFETVQQAYFPEFNGKITAEHWNEAYRDMIRAQKLFHDPSGIKRLLSFGQIEPLVYKRNNPPRDYMNEAKAIWHDPTSLEITSDESAWELWEKALLDGRKVLDAASAVFAGPEDREEAFLRFSRHLGNVSYETGKAVDAGAKISFADPIL